MDEDQEQVRTSNQQLRRSTSGQVVIARLIYYIGGVISTFLIARIVLLLLAANQGSPFVDFVYTVGGFFAWPFYGIFSYQPHYGQSVLEMSSIVALVVYAVITFGLVKLVTLSSSHRDAV